ncbi:MarR family winged helix-turn-helix transcriptional regulator [Nocardioides jiangxiensis]|uniref:MarR family transcriptional regulator n=1 Tax=Nocardioides jiangxiensis TaxID=3064524 RepID=A0ABT9B0E7_9ACTN|nr:MarR family transcriptional regulator [Nocardioides sp. WY-20]MDO7867092.1 MarR family transcriptional regulator [Nocardioides sp. WY-20]
MAAPKDPIHEAHAQWLRHGWEDAADGMAMVTSLTRVQQLFLERIDATLKPFGLTFARFEVIRLISFTRSGSMTMSRLGSLLQVHATTVTSAVERLVQQGYVERHRSKEDRRVIHASLTPEGSRVVDEATAALNAAVFARPGLAPADTAQLLGVLTELRGALGDLPV